MFLAIILTLIACHYTQESSCSAHANWSCRIAAAAYWAYAIKCALT